MGNGERKYIKCYLIQNDEHLLKNMKKLYGMDIKSNGYKIIYYPELSSLLISFIY